MKIKDYKDAQLHYTKDDRGDATGAFEMFVAEVPRSEMDNFNTPDLEQSPDSFLKPGETLEDFDVEFRRPNAEGGIQQLVKPSVDGSRPGYAKDEKGFGSEKGAKFKSPSKNQFTQAELIDFLEKKLGSEYKFKRGSLSADSLLPTGRKRVNYLQKMLADLLDRKSVATRGEQVRFLFNKPNAQQLDFIQSFIDSPVLHKQTVENMEILNKKFSKILSNASGKDFFRKKLTLEKATKALFDKTGINFSSSQVARAMTRLAQTYQGKLFRNNPNIKVNKKIGDFMFKSFNELDQYHPWRQGSYEAVLDDIDSALGKKVGNISAFKTKFKEKMQILYPDRKFNFNEIFSISTSANRGSYPYAYFVDLTEDAMNKGALASLQGKASIAEGKIQENITKYRKTGNIKFYDEAVRVAGVYNNTTRANFLDSKKVLKYEKKYGIKPNAYKIEIGSKNQVKDKLNFAKNYYKNKDLNKWKNLGIDIDSHTAKSGYVKTFDSKVLPTNVTTAPELFTEETRLQKSKVIDEKSLNKFFQNNKNIIQIVRNNKQKSITDAAIKTAEIGGFGKKIKVYCGGKASGGRIGFKNGTDVCPAATKDPEGFLKRLTADAEIGKFFKSPKAVGIAKNVARAGLNAANPLSFIGGEIFYVGLESANSVDKGIPLDEALDKAFIFYNFDKAEKNIMAKAEEQGFDENQLNLLQSTINLNKLDNKQLAIEKQFDVAKDDFSEMSSDLSMGAEIDLPEVSKQIADESQKYINSLDKMGFDLSKDESYNTGFNYLDNVFRKKTKDELVKVYDERKRKLDPEGGRIGDVLKPIFDTQSYTQPLKFAADIFNPFTKNVSYETDRAREQRYLNEMDEKELYLYNKRRGFDLDSVLAGTSPYIDKAVEDKGYGQAILGKGLFQNYAGGGIAGLSGGDKSGPPPESGPASQGLRSLIKNGRKL